MNERKMRRKRYLMLAGIVVSVLSTVFIVHGESRTFLRPRSAIEDVSLFLGLNNYNIYSKFYAPHNCTDDKKHQQFLLPQVYFLKNQPMVSN